MAEVGMRRKGEEVRFSSLCGPVLAGSLALPFSGQVESAVLMVGGSGPADRTNGGFFTPIRDHLLQRGAAVFTFDKRGVGLSEGCWYTADVDDLADDAAAGLAMLERGTQVRRDRAVVFGHSEGAWVGLRLAARSRFGGRLVLNSCPSVAFLDAEVHALRSGGSSPQRADCAGDYLAELARLAAAGADVSVGREHAIAVAQQAWFVELEAAGFCLDDSSWAQLGAWGGYDPRGDLLMLRSPTLSLFGAEDPLVPVARSVAVNDETAAITGRLHVSEVIAGVGHRMSSGQGDRISPAFLDEVTAWCTFSG